MKLVNCEQDRIGQTSSECFTCGMNVILWNFSLYVLGQEMKYISYCGSQSKITALAQTAQFCLKASAWVLFPRYSFGNSSYHWLNYNLSEIPALPNV